MRTVRPWLASLLAFGLLSCHQTFGRRYELDIDPALETSQQQTFIDAAADWSAKVDVTITPVVKTCSGAHDGVLCVHGSTQAYVNANAKGCLAPGCSAFTQWSEFLGWRTDGGETWIAADTFAASHDPNFAPTIFEHELGHGMGLVHTGPGTLMAALYADDAHTATPADVEQWDALRGISPTPNY